MSGLVGSWNGPDPWMAQEGARKRHPLPFQNGLRLHALFEHYGDEDRGDEAWFRLRWPDGFVCPHGGHDQRCHRNPCQLRPCDRCHRPTSIIAGTIFESSKLPLTTEEGHPQRIPLHVVPGVRSRPSPTGPVGTGWRRAARSFRMDCKASVASPRPDAGIRS